MFLNTPITGDKLPDKTLCFTYDDGPISQLSHTLRLGKYLSEHHIPATFFVVGQQARKAPDTLTKLHKMGHLIANHTENHIDLTTSCDSNQILQTDIFLRKLLPAKTIFMRPPYGSWNHQISSTLNAEPRLTRCIGPIGWDIDGHDWSHWRDGLPAEQCADNYLQIIERRRRGIVLFHDNADVRMPTWNQGLKLARILILQLQSQGYQFVGLDELPQIRALI